MTAQELSAAAGVLVSLAFSYIPGLNSLYDTLDKTGKRLVMLVALAVVSGAAFGLSCSGVWDFVACDQAGAKGLLEAFLFAMIANQSTYLISPVQESYSS